MRVHDIKSPPECGRHHGIRRQLFRGAQPGEETAYWVGQDLGNMAGFGRMAAVES